MISEQTDIWRSPRRHRQPPPLQIHVYDTATSRPVAVILRPGKTPSGRKVRSHLRRLVHADLLTRLLVGAALAAAVLVLLAASLEEAPDDPALDAVPVEAAS